MPEQRPLVGVAIMIFKDGKVLMGRRLANQGVGKYQFPGGHLEYMESFEDCARRECREECGLEIKNIRFQSIRNQKEYPPNHRVMMICLADWASGEPENFEPEKNESWQWYDLNNLPEPFLETTTQALESMKIGQVFFDN
jgi:8-oxo-dGTP diphosphatase